MSYTGAGIIGSHVALEPPHPADSGMIAVRDITRTNGLGQTVVMVPQGQPIPKGLAVDPADAVPAPPRENTPPAEPRRRPEPFVTGPERQALFSERALSLLRRRR